MNLFSILIINFFLKHTIAEIINIHRINEAIRNSILHLEDIPIKNDSIIFKYEKYQIICYNFRIIYWTKNTPVNYKRNCRKK